MTISIKEVISILPHRYPFLLIDRVLELELGQSILGIKNITVNEPQFTGHFPGNPIMPGVLIVEAMAQLAAILIAKSLNLSSDNEVFLLAIEGAKFRRMIQPGDTMYIRVKIEQHRGEVWKFSSDVTVGDVLAAESKFTAMVRKIQKKL